MAVISEVEEDAPAPARAPAATPAPASAPTSATATATADPPKVYGAPPLQQDDQGFVTGPGDPAAAGQGPVDKSHYMHEHIKGVFGAPDVFTKLSTNIATRPYLEDPNFVKLVRRLGEHPEEIRKYSTDPRVQALMGVLMADVSISVDHEDMTPENTVDMAQVGREDEIPGEKEAGYVTFDDAKRAGNECFKLSQHVEAVRCYRRALDLADSPSERTVAHTNLAAVFLVMERFEDVATAATMALQFTPGHLKSLFRRSRARERQLRFKEALDDVMEGLKRSPGETAFVARERDLKGKIAARERIRREAEEEEKAEAKKFEATVKRAPAANRAASGYSEKNWSHWFKKRLAKRVFDCEHYGPGTLVKTFPGWEKDDDMPANPFGGPAPPKPTGQDALFHWAQGEVVVWQRGGMRGSQYTLTLKVPWRGVMLNPGANKMKADDPKKSDKVEGTINVDNISSENDSENDWTIEIERNKKDKRWKDGPKQERLEVLAKALIPKIKWSIRETLSDLQKKVNEQL